MSTTAEIIASRRLWIDEALRPWCAAASAKELRQAEQDWLDLAGRISPDFSLWMWAWSRYPGLVIPDLWRMDEAVELRVELAGEQVLVGFADARRTKRDQLVLILTGNRTNYGDFFDSNCRLNRSASDPFIC